MGSEASPNDKNSHALADQLLFQHKLNAMKIQEKQAISLETG
ncbi:MAG: hypothetical protein SH868_01890 [Bythopirellula sp.]|nr:hypothetical protein [Bythopirellula sp.]